MIRKFENALVRKQALLCHKTSTFGNFFPTLLAQPYCLLLDRFDRPTRETMGLIIFVNQI